MPRSSGPDRNPRSSGPERKPLSSGPEPGILSRFAEIGPELIRPLGIGCRGIEEKEFELSKVDGLSILL